MPAWALRVIRITLMNDGADAVTTIPNPVPAGTPTFTIVSGGHAAVSVDPATGAFVYAFEPGAALGVYSVTVEVVSGGQSFNQLVEITLNSRAAARAAVRGSQLR